MPNTLIRRITSRANLTGLSFQEVCRRAIRTEPRVETSEKRDVSTRGESESVPLDIPPGMTAREARARIVAALDATETACRPVALVIRGSDLEFYEAGKYVVANAD